MTKEEMIEMLRSGATSEEIAAEFTKTLNAAEQTLAEEKKSKDVELDDKFSDLEEIICRIGWYLENYGKTKEDIEFGKEIAEMTEEMSQEDKASLVKEFDKTIHSLSFLYHITF